VSATWVTPADVALFLGVPPAEAGDDDWLVACTDAANAFAFRRRAASGYNDDPATAPDSDVKQGTVIYAGSLYRERGAFDAAASFVELGTYVPTGGTWGQIKRLLAIDRMAVG
jgi:hypothetical protein